MWVLLVLLLASLGLQVQAVDQEHNNSELKCSEPCVNGSCLATGNCECFSGYQFLNGSQTVCEPICSEDCGTQARCTAPEKCSCNEGFVFNDTINGCKPLCSKRCLHGNCSGANKCTCLEGYVEFLWYVCVPICPKRCINSHCMAPNRCLCFTGYQPSPILGSHICEPICTKNCEHGRCTAPEYCSCEKGYAKRSADGVCELQTGSNIFQLKQH